MRNSTIGKSILKVISILLLPLPFIGIGIFLIYPYYNDIVILKESLNPEAISNSVTLKFFTSISPKQVAGIYEEDFNKATSVEYLTDEILAKYTNEGDVSRQLEPFDTKISVKSANISASIIDGKNAFAMKKGPWHFPLSNAPGEKGNFVVIGHRFAELPPSTNTFFNLDKIKVGDKISISQTGDVNYEYTVLETKVVEKDNRSVLQDYGDYRITLITCTPLWTSKQRLVVTGILDKAYRKI